MASPIPQCTALPMKRTVAKERESAREKRKKGRNRFPAFSETRSFVKLVSIAAFRNTRI
jgi:hypothetical protein